MIGLAFMILALWIALLLQQSKTRALKRRLDALERHLLGGRTLAEKEREK